MAAGLLVVGLLTTTGLHLALAGAAEVKTEAAAAPATAARQRKVPDAFTPVVELATDRDAADGPSHYFCRPPPPEADPEALLPRSMPR